MEKEKELKVGPGMVVAYSYKLFNEADGSLLFEAKKEAPDMMVYGVSNDVVPGLVAAMRDLKEGDRFGVTLPPEAAFGERYPDNVVTLEKDIFMRDGKLVEDVKEGAILPMMTAEGFTMHGRVIKIDDKGITMDFNHPFSGLTVRYDGEIESVREATPEELKPAEGCCGGGCGGNGGCCGGEQDHSCGNGSCCH